jgi:hypothetical protein
MLLGIGNWETGFLPFEHCFGQSGVQPCRYSASYFMQEAACRMAYTARGHTTPSALSSLNSITGRWLGLSNKETPAGSSRRRRWGGLDWICGKIGRLDPSKSMSRTSCSSSSIQLTQFAVFNSCFGTPGPKGWPSKQTNSLDSGSPRILNTSSWGRCARLGQVKARFEPLISAQESVRVLAYTKAFTNLHVQIQACVWNGRLAATG